MIFKTWLIFLQWGEQQKAVGLESSPVSSYCKRYKNVVYYLILQGANYIIAIVISTPTVSNIKPISVECTL